MAGTPKALVGSRGSSESSEGGGKIMVWNEGEVFQNVHKVRWAMKWEDTFHSFCRGQGLGIIP